MSHSPLFLSYLSLSPVSLLRLLQALLDVDLVSAVLCVTTSPALVGPRPLEVTDGALYPLGSQGAHRLTAALCGLLLKVLVLLRILCVFVCECVNVHERGQTQMTVKSRL